MATEADDTSPDDPGAGPPPPAIPVRVAKGPPPARRRAVVGGLLVAGLAVVAVVVVQRGDRGRSAADALADARAAVEGAGSYRFTQHLTWVTDDGDPGTTAPVVGRITDEGEWIDGAWHVVSSDGSSATETIARPDGTVYHRSDGAAASGTVDARVPWDAIAADDEPGLVASLEQLAGGLDALGRSEASLRALLDETAVDAAVALYLRGGGRVGGLTVLYQGPGRAFDPRATPTSFLDAVGDLGEPALDGARTLTATLRAPDDVAEALDHPIPDGRIEVDLGPDDLPTEVRLDVAAGATPAEVALTFANWGAPLVIAPPAGDGVDTTPWLEEDELREVDVAPVVPAGLLESDGLRVTVGRANDRFSDGPVDCDLLEVSDGGDLRLVQTSRRCALAIDATPFAPGGPGGLAARPSAGTVQVLVGDTMVEIWTALSGSPLDELAVSLAPVAVDSLITAAGERPEGWTLGELPL